MKLRGALEGAERENGRLREENMGLRERVVGLEQEQERGQGGGGGERERALQREAKELRAEMERLKESLRVAMGGGDNFRAYVPLQQPQQQPQQQQRRQSSITSLPTPASTTTSPSPSVTSAFVPAPPPALVPGSGSGRAQSQPPKTETNMTGMNLTTRNGNRSFYPLMRTILDQTLPSWKGATTPSGVEKAEVVDLTGTEDDAKLSLGVRARSMNEESVESRQDGERRKRRRTEEMDVDIGVGVEVPEKGEAQGAGDGGGTYPPEPYPPASVTEEERGDGDVAMGDVDPVQAESGLLTKVETVETEAGDIPTSYHQDPGLGGADATMAVENEGEITNATPTLNLDTTQSQPEQTGEEVEEGEEAEEGEEEEEEEQQQSSPRELGLRHMELIYRSEAGRMTCRLCLYVHPIPVPLPSVLP